MYLLGEIWTFLQSSRSNRWRSLSTSWIYFIMKIFCHKYYFVMLFDPLATPDFWIRCSDVVVFEWQFYYLKTKKNEAIAPPTTPKKLILRGDKINEINLVSMKLYWFVKMGWDARRWTNLRSSWVMTLGD